MANNKIQVKRTSVAGRQPNTTVSTNAQYISAGEFALNMADQILYTSNGSVVIPVGANNVNLNVTGNATINAIIANGSLGTANQVLTSNGSGIYWGTGGGSSVVTIAAGRVYQTFTATDGQTVFTVTGGYVNGAIDVFYNGVHLSNTEYTQDGSTVTLTSGANSGAIVEVSGYKSGNVGNDTEIYFNNGGSINSNQYFTFNTSSTKLSIGNSSVNTQITPGNVSLNGSTLVIGNTATNVTINSTSISLSGTLVNTTVYSGTANSANYIGSLPAANVVSNAQLQSNLSNYQTTADLASNVATLTANNTSFVGTISAANVVSNAQLSSNLANYVTSINLTNNLANYQTTAGLSANVATLTANNTSFVGTVSAANVVSNAQLSSNLSNYQTTAGLSSNVATLTANNTSFVGIVSASNVVSNAQLSANLNNYAALSGATFTGNVIANNANTTYDLNIGRNLYVTGNLTIGSNVNIIGANNLSIIDNMIYLNSNSTWANPDLGIAANYNDGTYHHTGIFRDHSDGTWKVFDNYLPEPDANIYIDTSNNTFHLANFQANTIYVGNTTVYSTINTTSFNGTANNTSFVGTVSAANVVSNSQLSSNLANYVTSTNLTNNLANYQTTAGLSSNVATLTANNTSFVGTVSAANVVSNAQLSANLGNYQTTAGLATNVATLTSNNSSYFGGNLPAYYTNATNITTGTLPYAQLGANVVNTSAAFTITGVYTYSANIYANTVLISSNTSATSIATGATANGSTQGTAYPIVTTSVEFTTVAAGTGAILPSAVPGQRCFIANDGANNLLLYPAVGGVIDQTTLNSPVTIVPGGMWEGVALTSLNWTSISPDTQSSATITVTQGNGIVTSAVNQGAQYTWTNTHTFNTNVYANNSTLYVSNSTANVLVVNTGGLQLYANLSTNTTGVQFFGPQTETANTPTYTWTGDSNTGMWNPLSGTIAFSSIGSQVVTINAAGLYTTGTVNATSYTTGATGLGTGGLIANVTTLYIGNNTVNAYLNTTGLNINAVTIANTTGVYTGVVNGSSLTVSTSLIGNSTGIYHTGTINAASHTTGATGLGTGGLIANVTTLYIGNNTVNAYLNTTGLNINAATVANTLGVYTTGTVNAAVQSVGTSFIANTTQVTVSGIPVSANGGTGTSGTVLTSNGATGSPYWKTDQADIVFVIDGGGSALTTGQKGHLEIPFNCTITQWTLINDQSGNVVIDIWKSTYANAPPTVSNTITGTATPNTSSAQKNQSSTLTGWTTTCAAGDILAFNVNSINVVTRASIMLRVTKT